MTVDLSDPAVISAIGSIADPVSPISWISFAYHPTREKTFVLVSTGFDPWVPQWQETITARSGEPLFGYGVVAKGRAGRDGGEKGVILVYLPENITYTDGAARAVVHSRALINTFPDYSAIITISDPSQISEEFVRDQVNYYNQPVPTPSSTPVKPRTPAQLGLGLGHGLPAGNGSPHQQDDGRAVSGGTAAHPAGGNAHHTPSTAIKPSSSSIRSVDRPLPPPPPPGPLDLPDNPRMNGTPTPPRTSTPPPRGTSTPPAPSSPSIAQAQQNHHGRKDSLSSRFAKALPIFGKSSSHTAQETLSPPRSPRKSTFEALTSGFGTGRQGSLREQRGNDVAEMGNRAPQNDDDGEHRAVMERASSPIIHNHAPVSAASVTGNQQDMVSNAPHPNHADSSPRLDTPPAAPASFTPSTGVVDLGHDDVGVNGRLPHASSSDGAAPPPLPPKDLTRSIDSPRTSEPAPPLNRLFTLGAIVPTPPESANIEHLSQQLPSAPSSGVAFPAGPILPAVETIRAREAQMHDDFRRTEEERERIRTHSGNREARITSTPTPTTMRKYGEEFEDEEEEEGLPYDRPDKYEEQEVLRPEHSVDIALPTEPTGDAHELSRPGSAAVDVPGAYPRYTEAVDAGPVSDGHGLPPTYSENGHSDALQGPTVSATAGAAELGAIPIRASLDAQRAEREAATAKEEERVAQERADERARVIREAHEARVRESHEEEQRRILAEAKAHAEAEERARKQAEEEAKARAEAEEKARKQAEEEARAKAEAEARAAVEQEKRRKEESVNRMKLAKQNSGELLQGHLTVQTTKSVIWRRRYFHLFPSEIRLFKEDTDTSPIQIIPLRYTTKVLQKYEESQVQGSLKLVGASDNEDFFVFSDSAEEREMLLQALTVALEA